MTWIGDTVVPNMTDKDTFTLVLKKTGDSYTGNIVDSTGMVDAGLENVKFESDTLSFSFVVSVNGQNVGVTTTLKLKEGRLVGSWDADVGVSGSLDMARKTH